MWSRHLSREGLLASVEGRATAQQTAHLTRCDRCRRDVEALHATLAMIREVEVPEPSPLFWDRLSERVGQAIARDQVPGGAGAASPAMAWRSRLWFAGAGAAVALAVTLTWQSADRTARQAVPAAGADEGADAPVATFEQSDGAWELLVSLADAADDESSEELVGDVHPGMADRALLGMSDAERTVLVDLLETELRQPSS